MIDQPAQFDPKKTGTDASTSWKWTRWDQGWRAGALWIHLLDECHCNLRPRVHYIPPDIFNLSGVAFVGGFFPNGHRMTNAWFQTPASHSASRS